MKHYLLTLPIGDAHMHGYVMCQHQSEAMAVMDKMIELAEEIAGEFDFRLLPITLMTDLSTDSEIVRSILAKHHPEAKPKYERAKKQFMAIWILTDGTPDDQRLMELH